MIQNALRSAVLTVAAIGAISLAGCTSTVADGPYPEGPEIDVDRYEKEMKRMEAQGS